ncbi:MAG: response regulator [Xanthobacteraceae bacterium]|jgi:CheY-like chemotaxis protein
MINRAKSYKVMDILLVEDNPGDVRLMQEALLFANTMVRMHVVADGLDAMAFLRHEGIYQHSPRPDVILLDLRLPNMNGYEVLSRIKADEKLKSIPAVVLSSSQDEADVGNSYQLHANSYLSKPQGSETFEGIVKCINEYWFARVRLPVVTFA